MTAWLGLFATIAAIVHWYVTNQSRVRERQYLNAFHALEQQLGEALDANNLDRVSLVRSQLRELRDKYQILGGH